jgi:peptide deformylase
LWIFISWEPWSVRILKYPHPTLKHKSKLLRRVDAELKKIVREMFDLMYLHKGIGLAANQVDLPYRLFITNLTSDPAARDEEKVFINPVLTRRTGMAEADEGCLSFPEIYAPVRRPEKAVVSGYNLSGEEIHWELSGLFARAVQHEYDHLEGILFIDRLSPSNLAAIRDDLTELELEFAGNRERGLIPGDHEITSRLMVLEGLRA